MNEFDQLVIHKILKYFDIIQIHQIKSISKNFLSLTESFIPYQLYHSIWIDQMINTFNSSNNKNNLDFFLQSTHDILHMIIPPWIERLLLDAAKLGNLNTLVWVKNTYFINKFDLRRANRCLVYTAHHQNLSMVDFLIKYILDHQEFDFEYCNEDLNTYPNLYRTYISCIRLQNSTIFKHLWNSFPICDKKLINQLLLNCEIYQSIKIYFIILQFLKEE